jgi:hypothetical protein
MRKLTPGEIKAYRELAEAAKKLRRAQERAENGRRADKDNSSDGVTTTAKGRADAQ